MHMVRTIYVRYVPYAYGMKYACSTPYTLIHLYIFACVNALRALIKLFIISQTNFAALQFLYMTIGRTYRGTKCSLIKDLDPH